ncbi:TolC family protein [Clostridium autoethanogenum]|uniref:TolC family protein n=1 Tax=Clostridium autoethanogenum TaxID=84023 RepID=A0A3M0S3V9_9CLOT|nr:TolC family protein [Clostridium autoethanogenum]RMC92334.1 TolC family protein [Clostridium autoethanogenum]
MKNKLSAAIGLMLALSISSTCFAANNSTITPVNSILGDATLTLDQVLNDIEKNSVSIQTKDQKILLYQRQFDRDNMNAALINNSGTSEANYPSGQYVNIKLTTDVIPKADEQNIKDAKHDKDDSLQNLKFSTEQQYLNALTNEDQINTINDQIKNVDQQIAQTNVKIANGQLTNNDLQSLQVQKSQLEASLNQPKAQLQQNLLSIKQTINMDLDGDLTLVPAEKSFVKYDDSNIEDKINKAVDNNYNISKIDNNLDILRIKEDIYKQYSHNDASGEVSTGLSIEDLENSRTNTILTIKTNLWNGYYGLKSLEDAVETEQAKVASAQSTYDTTEAKVQQGVAVQLQADSAALALKSEKINLKNAINNYMVTVEQFEYNLTQ